MATPETHKIVLPDDLVAFLRSGRQLEYDPSACQPGKVVLKSIESLHLIKIFIDSEETPFEPCPSPDEDDICEYNPDQWDPHCGEGFYAIQALQLIAENTQKPCARTGHYCGIRSMVNTANGIVATETPSDSARRPGQTSFEIRSSSLMPSGVGTKVKRYSIGSHRGSTRTSSFASATHHFARMISVRSRSRETEGHPLQRASETHAADTALAFEFNRIVTGLSKQQPLITREVEDG